VAVSPAIVGLGRFACHRDDSSPATLGCHHRRPIAAGKTHFIRFTGTVRRYQEVRSAVCVHGTVTKIACEVVTGRLERLLRRGGSLLTLIDEMAGRAVVRRAGGIGATGVDVQIIATRSTGSAAPGCT
jgi:hypothetical protein